DRAPFCPREPGLRLRPYRRCDGQSGPSDLGSNRRQHPAPAQPRSGARRVRTTTWKEFIRSHIEVLAATDLFTVEVLTWGGLGTYYVLFFIEIGSRPRVVGRHHAPSGLELDGTSGAPRHDAVHRIPERLSKLIFFGENSLRSVVSDFLEHNHQERNH